MDVREAEELNYVVSVLWGIVSKQLAVIRLNSLNSRSFHRVRTNGLDISCVLL